MVKKTDPNACLRRKECGLCQQPLTRTAKGHCGSLFDRDACWWVSTIRDYGAREALRMSNDKMRDRAVSVGIRHAAEQ